MARVIVFTFLVFFVLADCVSAAETFRLSDGEEDLNRNGRVDAGETDPSFLAAGALPAILSLLIGD